MIGFICCLYTHQHCCFSCMQQIQYLHLRIMKVELLVYKILSFILLPVAIFFGILCLLSLLTALGNPSMLVSVFLNACMVIYIIASFQFLTKGIDPNKRVKTVLRDWIRINGIITMAFYLVATMVFLAVKSNPSLLDEGMKQMQMQGNLPNGVTMEELKAATGTFINYFLVLSLLLLVHIIITFHLMGKFRYLFEPEMMDKED